MVNTEDINNSRLGLESRHLATELVIISSDG